MPVSILIFVETRNKTNNTKKLNRNYCPTMQIFLFNVAPKMPHIPLFLALFMMLPRITFADFGMPALRLYCPVAGGAIEIEPYIAWNDNNSRYKEFQVEQAKSTCCHHQNSDTTYFSYAWKDKDFIYTPCATKTRHLDIFVVRESITVVEDGEAPIQNHDIGYVWKAAGGISFLRSDKKGNWQICEGSEVNIKQPIVCKALTPRSSGTAHKRAAP